MFGLFFVLSFFVFSFTTEASRKSTKLTPFQQNIQDCLQDQVDGKEMISMQKVYDSVAKKYLLLSSEVIGREVSYKVKEESRKLKYEDGKVQLYKILEDEDDRMVPIDNDLRQKSLTVEAYMTQLLIHADVRSDWMKSSEKRAGGTSVLISTVDGEMKNLVIEREKMKKKLDCNRSEGVESCSCIDLK